MAENKKSPSRRDFLIGMAVGTAGGILTSAEVLAAAKPPEYGFLIDTTLCKYCLECEKACEEVHDDGTPGTHYTEVKLTHPQGEQSDPLAVPMHCLHCIDAPCVPVCQGKALEETTLGPVILDDDKCIGCLSCISVCPFEKTIHYQSTPAKIFKCDLCYDRIVAGDSPACVDACEKMLYDALSFGPFTEILEKGQKRAAEIGGLLMYPERTSTLILFEEGKFNAPMMTSLFGTSRNYPMQAKAKATLTRLAHWAWLPLIGGWVYYMRENRIDRSTGPEKEEV